MNIRNNIKLSSLIIPIFVILFNLLILLNPKTMIESSKNGLLLWFNNVLPSLLPFLITTNILTKLKVINLFGVIFQPIMQPLFGVNGNGSFPLAVGITSGYPVGAKVVSDLRKENLITKTEGQRLLSFVNNSSPLFILGTVGIGILGSVEAGYFLFIIHFIGAILNGILFKHFGKEDKEDKKHKSTYNKLTFKDSINTISGVLKTRGFSEILSDSLTEAISTVLSIGGFIIFFSVIVKAVEISNIIVIFENLLSPALKNFNINTSIFSSFFYGIFEITGGINRLSGLPIDKTILLPIGFLLSFAGLSIHCQSASFISKTDMKISIYILSKITHGLITVVTGYLLFPFFDFKDHVAVFNTYSISPINQLKGSLVASAIVLTAFASVYFFISFINALSYQKNKKQK